MGNLPLLWRCNAKTTKLNGLCQSAYYAQSKVHRSYDGPPPHLLEFVQSKVRQRVSRNAHLHTTKYHT